MVRRTTAVHPPSRVDRGAYRTNLMRYRLLGPLEVTDGSDPLPLGGPKQRLVLAHLLLRANHVVPADLLIDQIWGDEPPAAARATLQAYVSNLRRVIGADRLVGRPAGYLLRVAPDEIDAARFEAMVVRARRRASTDPAATARTLRDAEGLWHGDPLADLSSETSLWPEIERLAEMRIGALEDLAAAELELGRHVAILADLERLQRAHPLRERLASQLMLALYRSGRQADALAAYHRLRSALADDLGVEPSPALERIQRLILNHDPSLELRGEPLRGYRLIEPLGSGRHGMVHRAFEPQAEREVAIKILGARVANDAEFIRRFDAAARRVSRLEHPHVVALHDWWREPEAAHLVMRLMDGGSLARRIEAGPIEEREVLLWAEQVGSGLAAAHRRGVVHGDVRPVNILLDADGNAFLADFAVGYDPAGNGSGPASAYLAPERQAGGPPSPAADVYAFGAIVTTLLESAGADTRSGELGTMLARVASPAPAERPATPTDVVDVVRRALLGVAQVVDAGDLVGQNPYKGLRAFEEADADDFFGREDLIGRLVARMGEETDASRLLAIVGPSGSGKSSLAAAGLVPALRAGALEGSEHWFVVAMAPGAQPFDELERALESISVHGSTEAPMASDGDRAVHEAIERSVPPGSELLLVIDQFEELFTLTDEAVAGRFLDALATAVDHPASRVRVVITLRADFYDRPLGHERFGGQLAARTHAIGPLTPEQLARVVAAPAERVGLRPEAGLVARMVAEMSDRPGTLPLLQYALTELWERRDGTRLTLEAYDASGGIAAAVARRAEQVVLELEDAGRETARQLFLRLVEPGEGTEDTARRVLRSDLVALAADAPLMASVIDRFARYRMLLLDRDPETRGPTVELAHEALLRAWPRLRAWVDAARDDLRRQRQLAAATSQWLDGGRDPSFLLTGSRLGRADEWAAATEVLLGPREREYLAASVAQRQRIAAEEEARRQHEIALERRAMTRLRALVVAMGIGALIAGGLSVYAALEGARAEREARTATARELAAAAVANLVIDPERAILLALEAVHTTRTADGSVLPEVEDALHRAVTASRLVQRVPSIGAALAWSPDGELFVSEGPEDSGLLDLLRVATGESVGSGPWTAHEVDVNTVTFSQDGSLLLSTGDDGTAAAWDLEDRQRLRYRVQGTGHVWGPTFSPDGMVAAAVWSDEDMLRLWDAATGTNVREIPVAGRPWGASFSPDGTRLAIPLQHQSAAVVLDIASGELLPFRLEHGIYVFDIAWSPDGHWIATAGRVPAIRIWDAETGERKYSVFSHDGQSALVRWSPDPAAFCAPLRLEEPCSVLATGGSDGTARLWRVTEDHAHELFHVASRDTALGIGALAFSPDGDRLLTGGRAGDPVMTGGSSINGMQMWDVSAAGEAEVLTRGARYGPQGGVAFLPDGRLAWSDATGSVTVSDPRSGAEGAIGAHGGIVPAIGVSPDGELVATAGENDQMARVWDVASGAHRFDVEHEAAVMTAAWNSEGSHMASADNSGLIRIVNRSGEEVATLADADDTDIMRVVFSPDGRWLAVVREGREGRGVSKVAIWDWEAGRIESELKYARDVAFDTTGSRIATASALTADVDIWNLPEGDLDRTLAGEVSVLWGIAWSADDSTIAAGSFNGLIRLWDVESTASSLVLRGHTGPVNSLEFSPDGRQLASRSMDGITRIWALDLDDLIRIAGSKVHRELVDSECLQYLHIPSCPAGD
jgi:WD40 repeat protein/DNA-binding SARP family transcriptional activator